jgi:hypothetical protein
LVGFVTNGIFGIMIGGSAVVEVYENLFEFKGK